MDEEKDIEHPFYDTDNFEVFVFALYYMKQMEIIMKLEK